VLAKRVVLIGLKFSAILLFRCSLCLIHVFFCSCYANAVLQCLMFTRPLTTYLLEGLHSKNCNSTLLYLPRYFVTMCLSICIIPHVL
jgi:hypothetical protein